LSFWEEIKRRKVGRVAVAYAVVAWLLVEVVVTVEEPLHLPGWMDTFVIVLVLLGFPLALVLSWAYDLTPTGIERTKDLESSDEISRESTEDASQEQVSPLNVLPNSLAVLPFENMSDDPEQEYFSDGITEEVLNVLAKLPDLRVAARTSAFAFKGQNLDLRAVGDSLGVAYLIEGSVRKAGNELRITAQLIDATTDGHIWSQSYERDLSPANVFEIQSDIAQQISNALQVRLLDWEAQRPSDNPTAWDLHMRARYLSNRISSREDALEVRRLLERAIELDPRLAPAHAQLARLYLGYFIFNVQHNAEALDRAETYARRSLVLDPQDALGHFSLAGVLWLQRKLTEAIREAKRAIELNPSNDDAYLTLGRIQMRLGRLGEAKRSFDRVQQINPRFPGAYFWSARGTLHYLEGEIEQAVALWERARTMGSRVGPTRIMLAHYCESAGRHEDAQAIVQEMLSAQPELNAELGVEFLAVLWNEEWIPEDLEAQLRSAGLP